MTSQQKVSLIEVSQFDFDPENPRFFDVANGALNTDGPALARMLREENLEELVGSIGQQGFFPGEPLLVTPHPSVPGRHIVVEGNRRLAALRVLAGLLPQDTLIPPSLLDLKASATHQPTAVECFVFPARRDVLKYLGFRHISGPRRWEPLAKARYLADLIRNFYSTLDLEQQLRAVARDIGSRRDYVAQLLTALNLYERARNQNFYGLQRVNEQDIGFSLLSTALSYADIVKFLNLPRRDAVDVGSVNDQHAKELFSWMFAQDHRGETVLGESRRLKTLAAVVSSSQALVELRRSGNLDQAYVYTSGPGEAFAQRLEAAEKAIADCIGLISPSVVFGDHHLQKIEHIGDLVDFLQLLIQKEIRRGQRSRSMQQSLDADDA